MDLEEGQLNQPSNDLGEKIEQPEPYPALIDTWALKLNANDEVGGDGDPKAIPHHLAPLDPTSAQLAEGSIGGANYVHTYGYGAGRKNETSRQRPLAIGSHGLVNRWGLAEMHGQLYEWCGDLWHPSPLGGPQDGSPWEDPDPSPEAIPRADNRLLRGGYCIDESHSCRAAFRFCFRPGWHSHSDLGFRPCCLLPPGSLLGS